MDSLKMNSKDITEDNIEKIAALFPNCITEAKCEKGRLIKAINFDLLRQELSHELVDGQQERYQLNWPGKKQALLAANAPIAKTLRPYRDESVDFDKTQNLFIEGDNLDALKMLQETYLGRVKMIYIDPPYNTGNDYIYPDNFAETSGEYLLRSGQKDDENRLHTSKEVTGRLHSNWLSMIYSRLKLARNLLKDDGVIFISIDEHELSNLQLICNEIFGESNKIGIVSRSTGTRMGTGSRGIARELDYIVVYSKTNMFNLNKLLMSENEQKIYNQEDEKGRFLTRSLRRTGGENRREDRPSMYYPVYAPDGTEVFPIAPEGWESRWVCGKETYEQMLSEGMIEWKQVKKDGRLVWQVYQKHYIGEGRESSDLWQNIDGNKKATKELNALFDKKKLFDNPKPIGLIKKIIQLGMNADEAGIIIDFFAGSSTTAEAIMQLNAEDKGSRRFIMIQLPEQCSPKTEAYKAGYKTISDISKERIRRAGKKIRDNADEKDIDKLDTGFRVFKVDSSNMADVYYTTNTINQDLLTQYTDNIKPNRNPEDLLFQVLLDWGIDLTLPITKKFIQEHEVFFVDEDALIACFEHDGKITEEFVKELAQYSPLRVVFRDAGFLSDSVKINIVQIFKQLSPHTEVKTI